MRRIHTRLFYLTLTFLLICIATSCKENEDGSTEFVVRFLEFKFTTTSQASNGPVIVDSDKPPVLVFVDEEVTFENTSKQIELPVMTGGRDESPYPGPVNWRFDGGNPPTATGNSTTVTYANPGTYNVGVELVGTGSFIGKDTTYLNHVNVVLRPLPGCYIVGQVFDDGRSAEYKYSDSHRLERVNYSFNDDLVEFHLFDYDSEDRLETQSFYNAINELLGTRGLIYDDESHVINDKTVNTDDNILLEVNINWENGFAIDGTYTQGDGSGPTTTVDLGFTNEEDNILQIDFLLNSNRIGYEVYGFDQNEKSTIGLGNIERFPDYLNRNNLESKTTYDSNDAIVELLERGIIYDADFCNLPAEIIEMTDGMNPVTIINMYHLY